MPLRSRRRPAAGVIGPPRHRRRRHAERRELVDQPLAPPARRAARARGTAWAPCAPRASDATCSLAAIIRCSISRCDSVCSAGSAAIDVALAVEHELRLAGLELDRGPWRRAARRAPRRPRAPRPEAAPQGSGCPLAAGEDPVDLPVVEPLVGADQRPIEAAAPHPVAVDLHLDRDRRRGPGPGTSEQALLDSAVGQHRLDRARARTRSCRGGTPPGRRATAGARTPRRRRCAPRPAPSRRPVRAAEIASSKSRARDRVDRERRQRAQVAPARPVQRLAGGSLPHHVATSCSTAGSNPRRSPRSIISASITSRATSGRPSRRAIDRAAGTAAVAGAARADDDQVADVRALVASHHQPRARPRRTARPPGTCRGARARRRARPAPAACAGALTAASAATVCSATVSASSGAVRGLSSA